MIRRLRRALLGREEAVEASGSPFASAARRWPGSMAADIPFETPPEEPVQLDPDDVPWELRDDADSGSSK